MNDVQSVHHQEGTRMRCTPLAGDIGEPVRHIELEPLEHPHAPVEPAVPTPEVVPA